MRRAWQLAAEDHHAVMMPYQPVCCTCSADLMARPFLHVTACGLQADACSSVDGSKSAKSAG